MLFVDFILEGGPFSHEKIEKIINPEKNVTIYTGKTEENPAIFENPTIIPSPSSPSYLKPQLLSRKTSDLQLKPVSRMSANKKSR